MHTRVQQTPVNDNALPWWKEAKETVSAIADRHGWSYQETKIPSEFGENGHRGGVHFSFSKDGMLLMTIMKYHDDTAMVIQLSSYAANIHSLRVELKLLSKRTETELVTRLFSSS